ncbi:hypothetical protein QBC36DRAFT_339606 [Triangularia setosa]|uniref:Uncharacterized protein n=1 Tax=Triangularia setosa TaxID=2587417 RepID=A0AAN6VXR4_9PEZI|nr:hypothetical protein QBC36DRAFT_339606 [Podospora setosa]
MPASSCVACWPPYASFHGSSRHVAAQSAEFLLADATCQNLLTSSTSCADTKDQSNDNRPALNTLKLIHTTRRCIFRSPDRVSR